MPKFLRSKIYNIQTKMSLNVKTVFKLLSIDYLKFNTFLDLIRRCFGSRGDLNETSKHIFEGIKKGAVFYLSILPYVKFSDIYS